MVIIIQILELIIYNYSLGFYSIFLFFFLSLFMHLEKKKTDFIIILALAILAAQN